MSVILEGQADLTEQPYWIVGAGATPGAMTSEGMYSLTVDFSNSTTPGSAQPVLYLSTEVNGSTVTSRLEAAALIDGEYPTGWQSRAVHLMPGEDLGISNLGLGGTCEYALRRIDRDTVADA